MIDMRQGFLTLSPPMKSLEIHALRGTIRHGNHAVLDWMAANTVARMDPSANIKPDKEKSQEKIDGIVAAIMALGLAESTPDNTSVYEDRGPLIIG